LRTYRAFGPGASVFVPAFHMTGFPACLVRAPVRRAWKHVAIGFPEVTNTPTAFIRRGNVPPQLAAGLFTAIPNGKATIWRVRRHRAVHNQRSFAVSRQSSTLHPAPVYRALARAAACPGRWLAAPFFFLTRPLAFAGRPQRSAEFLACWPLIVRRQNLGFLTSVYGTLGFNTPLLPQALPRYCCLPLGTMPVFHNLPTLTVGTAMSEHFLNHAPNYKLSCASQPLPKIHCTREIGIKMPALAFVLSRTPTALRAPPPEQ